MKTMGIKQQKKGSVMVATLVIATAIAFVVGVILQHSLTERKINTRHELRIQAKNASEAIAEYGFAQLKHKFSSRTNFSASAFDPASSDALKLPTENIFGSNVDYSASEIVGGNVPTEPETLTYIDPLSPFNDKDPLKGQKVFARSIGLYAKATVTDPRGGPDITSYTTQKLQVRDAPLFAHAIFYNLDLDLHPGPDMDIYGPVHTNLDLRVAPSNNLNFHNKVSVTGDLFHAYEHKSSSRTGHVRFPDRYGDLKSMYVGSSWKDSKMGDAFREYAADRWHSNLQTSSHGVPNYKPVAFADYRPDDLSTTAYDPINSGRAIIEPPLPSTDSEYDAEVEKQKMSNKACLYFKWDTTNENESDDEAIKLYRQNGTEIKITHLKGTGEDYLWEIRKDKLRERRRGVYITTVNLNMGKLKQLIENPDPGDAQMILGEIDAGNPAAYFNPANEWNGIIYFECKSSDTNATNRANLNHTGIRLWGGQVGAYKQGIPSRGDDPGDDPGMTFATNNVLYVQGHFNADGSTSSASAYQPENDEVPVALMGDAVTFISANYSSISDFDSDITSSKEPDAKTTEVSAAVVSGIRPPNKQGDDSYSGGAHNFPRFLENWTGRDFYLRGSMVCLYECEIDDSTWSTDYYNPPNRGYGFNDLFAAGTYPPGTPLLRAYRRINYTNISESTYNSAISSLTWNSGGGGSEIVVSPEDSIVETPTVPKTIPDSAPETTVEDPPSSDETENPTEDPVTDPAESPPDTSEDPETDPEESEGTTEEPTVEEDPDPAPAPAPTHNPSKRRKKRSWKWGWNWG